MQINTVRLKDGMPHRESIDMSYLMDIEFVLDDGRRVSAMCGTDLIVTTPDGTLIIIPEANNQISIQVRGFERMIVNEEQGDVRVKEDG